MHLINLLNKYEADENEKKLAQIYFKENTVSSASVENFIKKIR